MVKKDLIGKWLNVGKLFYRYLVWLYRYFSNIYCLCLIGINYRKNIILLNCFVYGCWGIILRIWYEFMRLIRINLLYYFNRKRY